VSEYAKAVRALRRKDPVLAEVIKACGPCTLQRPRWPAFEFLARSICYQQLAGAAASTIWGRVRGQVGRPFNQPAVLSTSPKKLRAAGLSAAKLASILDLAEKSADGSVKLRGLSRRTNEEVVEHLTTVRGIGRWTAEMFLIFYLMRLDVWPTGDLGVRNGYARAFGLAGSPTAKELEPLGDAFAPYRSVAAWYMWRVMDGPY
jgi:3-methyladenine DNA glycosylase/8-oxoguanine DNA glycosylase